MFDFAFLVDVTGYLNDVNLELQGKNKLSLCLVIDVSVFKVKLRLSISLLQSKDLSQLSHVIEQIEFV